MAYGKELDHAIAQRLATMPAKLASGFGSLLTDNILSERIKKAERSPLKEQPLAQAREEFERCYVRLALRLNSNHKARTAKYLGISREGLWKIIKRLDIE